MVLIQGMGMITKEIRRGLSCRRWEVDRTGRGVEQGLFRGLYSIRDYFSGNGGEDHSGSTICYSGNTIWYSGYTIWSFSSLDNRLVFIIPE